MKCSLLAKLIGLCGLLSWLPSAHASASILAVDSLECNTNPANNIDCGELRCLAEQYYSNSSNSLTDSLERRTFVYNISAFMNYINQNSSMNFVNINDFKDVIKQCSLLIGYADFHGYNRTVVYEDINDDLKLGTSDFTLETWLYIDEKPDLSKQPFTGKRETIFSRMIFTPYAGCSNHMQGYGLYLIHPGLLSDLEFYMYSDTYKPLYSCEGNDSAAQYRRNQLVQIRIASGLETKRWTHIAIRRSNDRLNYIIDGISRIPGSPPGGYLSPSFDVSSPNPCPHNPSAPPYNCNFRVGSRNTIDFGPIGPIGAGLDYTGSFFRGMRVWKRALTDQELTSIAADRCTFNAPVDQTGLVFSLPLLDPFETPYVAFKDAVNPNRAFQFQSVSEPMGTIFHGTPIPPSLNAEFSKNCASCCPTPNQPISTWINRDGPSKRPIFNQQNAIICDPN